jgi:hypothetical protein
MIAERATCVPSAVGSHSLANSSSASMNARTCSRTKSSLSPTSFELKVGGCFAKQMTALLVREPRTDIELVHRSY